jgi:hypothetical protein
VELRVEDHMGEATRGLGSGLFVVLQFEFIKPHGLVALVIDGKAIVGWKRNVFTNLRRVLVDA